MFRLLVGFVVVSYAAGLFVGWSIMRAAAVADQAAERWLSEQQDRGL